MGVISWPGWLNMVHKKFVLIAIKVLIHVVETKHYLPICKRLIKNIFG